MENLSVMQNWGQRGVSFYTRFKIVGFFVCSRQIIPLANKIYSIHKISRPKSVSELRSFIGLVNWYRAFYLNFGELIYPLNKLVRKGVPFQWSQEQGESF